MDRARMVAVVVPSPATSLVFWATALTSLAPMFSNGSGRSISLLTVTPSLVTVGPPKLLSMMTFRPVGTSSSTRRSEEHTSELQSRQYLVCRLLLEKKKTKRTQRGKNRRYNRE